jgi:hypothetical protein
VIKCRRHDSLVLLLSNPAPSHLRTKSFIYPLYNQVPPFTSLLIYVYAIPHRSTIYWSPYTFPCCILSVPLLALPTVWSDNPSYLMLTKRPTSTIGGLHSIYRTREHATYNLVSDSLSLLNSLRSPLPVPMVWSDTSSYLMMTMRLSSVTGSHHSVNKTREYATCKLVTDNLSLLKCLYSSLTAPTVCSVTPSYLILAMDSRLP